MPRILVITAGFGEGHNTAAHSLAEALASKSPQAEVRVADPLMEASPRLTKSARWTYLKMINHLPEVWEQVYRFTDASDRAQHGKGWLAPAARHLRSLVDGFHPDAVVTSYPLYLGFWEDLYGADDSAPCPFYVLVTDSITINGVWARGLADAWFVTDSHTLSRMTDLGVPEDRVVVTGFPVSPRFHQLPREIAPPGSGRPCRVLFFPIGSRHRTRRMLREFAALPADPAWELTVVLGRQKDRLKALVDAEMKAANLLDKVAIVGWTREIPELMASHHLVVGKAGGATVHEARTAARPFIIHYIVPGQEEGNRRLLEVEGGGCLAAGPGELQAAWDQMARDDWAGWKTAHQALLDHAPAAPANEVADQILRRLS